MTVSGSTPASILPLLERNAAEIRSVVAGAARRAGRDPAGVLLLAATKTVEAAVVALLPSVGILDAGENRVQEAEPKVRALSDLGLRWHMIGRLQTNKVRRALDLFHRIQSVDRDSVMDALAEEGARRGRIVDCLVQVNLSNEPTKGGYGMADAGDALRRIRSLPSLSATGLMAIPAPSASPEGSRAAFRALRELRDRLRLHPGDLRDLSMGMSGDYGVAVEEGATIVRVGSALFAGLPASAFGRSAAGGER
jgi:pyridoxal phosphate enzyme (YggS family)